jgi:cysteinyl-tRNA synthetase
MSTTALRLYNTMTQRIEPIEPIEPGHVRMYVCGLTPYDRAHAGHARMGLTFDVLVRFLRERGLRVTFVRNVTDIDDKILKRAGELGEAPLALSARMSRVADEEFAALGCLRPDFEPRVSESIPDIVALIAALVEKGAAYPATTAKGTDVYFAVRSFAGYGKLSGRNVDDLLSGARIEPGESKRDPLDFALWKGGEAEGFGWNSPWGKGRPGWHIECSAMGAKLLSPHFDIHGGGMDLIFPHHENEIAQSEAAWGEPFARLWMHNGFVNVDAEKMSKSLGNFVTIGQILERNDGEALRYLLLGVHYRGPVHFEVDKLADGRVVFPGLDEAERRVEYLYATREALVALSQGQPPKLPDGHPSTPLVRDAAGKAIAALDNDLNTSVALSVVAELARAGNELAQLSGKRRNDPGVPGLAAAMIEALDASCRPMGLMQATAEEFRARTRARRLVVRGIEASDVEAKVKERSDARAAKDFAKADALRKELTAMGIELQDVPGGGPTKWSVLI